MEINAKYFVCMACVVSALVLAPNGLVAAEPDQDWAMDFGERDVDYWHDFLPFVAVLGGVAGATDSYGDDTPLYRLWGPMLGVRGGLSVPFGFRLVLSAQSLPYTHDDDAIFGKYFSSTILSARVGLGFWVSSFYLGFQYGKGYGYRVFDDERIKAQTEEWSGVEEFSIVADWHVADGFYTCEASINAFFGGLLCGYGWTF